MAKGSGILKRKLTRRKLQRVIVRYLDTRHSVLFGRSWDINSKRGKRQAAEWLEKVITEMDEMGPLE